MSDPLRPFRDALGVDAHTGESIGLVRAADGGPIREGALLVRVPTIDAAAVPHTLSMPSVGPACEYLGRARQIEDADRVVLHVECRACRALSSHALTREKVGDISCACGVALARYTLTTITLIEGASSRVAMWGE